MKLDEMSVSSMIDGFLSDQRGRSNLEKKENLKKRNKEFFKVFGEALTEAAPKDWDKSSEPDDWRQTFEAPTKAGNLTAADVGAFTDSNDPEPETARTSSNEPKQKNRSEISTSDIGKRVKNKIELMKTRDPEAWSKFQSMSPDQQKIFKIKLGMELAKNASLNIKKGGADSLKGGASAAAKRRDVVSGLVKNLFGKLAPSALDPDTIDPKLVAFSKKFLGLDPSNKETAVNLIHKYAQASEDQKTQIATAAAEKALSNPATALPLVKFMNSRLDMYPHQWMDKAEDFANKEALPSAKEDPTSGLGFGVKKIGKDVVGSTSTKRQHKTAAQQKREDEFNQKLADLGREDLKGKVIGRKHVGDSAMHRLFSNHPIDDVAKYGDYFTQNPEEIERAKEERRNPPPEDVMDLMGKIPNVGDEDKFKRAEIGSENEKSSILGPADLAAAKRDYASKLAKFKDGQKNIEKHEQENGKTDYVFPAGMQYEKPFDLNYKEMFKNLTDVGTLDEPKQKIPGLTSRLVRDLSNRMNLLAKKSGEDSTSPEAIMDVLKKLAKYDSKGRYQGLSDSPEVLQNLAPEEGWVARELVRIFNPKRMMKPKDVAKPEIDLPKAFSDYASSELEKMVANIPARDAAIKQEKEKQDRQSQEKQRSLDVEKKSAMTPEQIKKQDQERIQKRDSLRGAMNSRIQQLPAEIDKEISSREDILGNKDEYNELKKYVAQNAQDPADKETSDTLAGLYDYERSRRDPDKMKKRMKLKKTSSQEKEKLKKAFPHAQKAKNLSDINPKSAHVPSKLGPTKKSPSGGIDAQKKRTPEILEPRQEPTGKVVGSSASDIAFKYDREPTVQFRKKLLQNLINDARKKVASLGGGVDAKTMMQYIINNFQNNKYPKAYDQIKDVVLAKGPIFMRPTELKKENKQMKKLSLIELLTFIDKNEKEPEHIDAKEENWEKADPEKKMNLTPKFSKQKKMGKK